MKPGPVATVYDAMGDRQYPDGPAHQGGMRHRPAEPRGFTDDAAMTAPDLREAARDLICTPALLDALGRNHVGGCECPLCRVRAAIESRPTEPTPEFLAQVRRTLKRAEDTPQRGLLMLTGPHCAEICRLALAQSRSPTLEDSAQPKERSTAREALYVASRASLPERPEMWRGLRAAGWPIIASWIDEAGPTETHDHEELWQRIAAEIGRATGLILFAETEDMPLKGALIEVGIALGMGKPVACVLPGVQLEPRSMRPVGSWLRHPLVTVCNSLDNARAALSHRSRPEAPTDGRDAARYRWLRMQSHPWGDIWYSLGALDSRIDAALAEGLGIESPPPEGEPK